MNNNFYIYIHIRLDTNRVFYVGKGKGNRAYSTSRRNPHWKHIVNKAGYRVQILEDNLNEETAFAKEILYIQMFRRNGEQLVNMTDGGEGKSGIPPPNKGKKMSEEQKQLLSELKMGDKNPNYGKPHSEDRKLKLSISNKKSHQHECKKIICNETGEIFASMHEASNKIGIYRRSIKRSCDEKKKITRGKGKGLSFSLSS